MPCGLRTDRWKSRLHHHFAKCCQALSFLGLLGAYPHCTDGITDVLKREGTCPRSARDEDTGARKRIEFFQIMF